MKILKTAILLIIFCSCNFASAQFSYIPDRPILFYVGISGSLFYSQSTIDGLRETLIREEFFSPEVIGVTSRNRNGAGISIAVPFQWQKVVYSQVGLSYEWRITQDQSDFKFENFSQPDKSFNLWLNTSYISLRVESGVSIPIPLKNYDGLMFHGMTVNLGVGFYMGSSVKQDIVKYESLNEPNPSDLKIQDDLNELIAPKQWVLLPYLVSRVGFNNFFIDFTWDFVSKDALIVNEENIYNLKDNDNAKSNFIVGVGYRTIIQKHKSRNSKHKSR